MTILLSYLVNKLLVLSNGLFMRGEMYRVSTPLFRKNALHRVLVGFI